MKHVLKTSMMAALFSASVAGGASAAAMKLPPPQKTGGKPLMELIDARHSTKEFFNSIVDNQTLSNLLWAAFGYNARGTRTIPTARDGQDLKVYVLMEEGTFLYNAKKNVLESISDQDFRPVLAKQDYVKNAPLTLVYVGQNEEYARLHAGSSYQNVALYAESAGLGAVVRAHYDVANVHDALKLKKKEKVLISVTIGHPIRP